MLCEGKRIHRTESGPHVWHSVYVRPLGFTVQSVTEATGAQCMPAEPTAGGSCAGAEKLLAPNQSPELESHTSPLKVLASKHRPASTRNRRVPSVSWVWPSHFHKTFLSALLNLSGENKTCEMLNTRT